jgi:hypothetical protein
MRNSIVVRNERSRGIIAETRSTRYSKCKQ